MLLKQIFAREARERRSGQYGVIVSLRGCKINVNVICLPTEHQGVHKNSFRNVRAFSCLLLPTVDSQLPSSVRLLTNWWRLLFVVKF